MSYLYLLVLKYLIVGLGNIGDEYADTRHNIGFMVLDALAAEQSLTFKPVPSALGTELNYKGRKYHLIKPTTYMNLSGKAVQYHLQYYKIPLENLLVITDDINLPFGTVRIRKEGADGGHNGLKHINQVLNTNKYARMRVGIDKNYHPGKQVEYVLAPFNKEEKSWLPTVCAHCSEAICAFGFIGIEKTMTLYNKALTK